MMGSTFQQVGKLAVQKLIVRNQKLFVMEVTVEVVVIASADIHFHRLIDSPID